MRCGEAKFIGHLLSNFAPADISPCLNVGSSTADFRTVKQPHIDAYIFRPLVSRGVEVVHADMKAAPGVDLVVDVLSSDGQEKLRQLKPKLVLCCNLLEHLTDPAAFAAACEDVIEPGDYILVSVPRSYPFHKDPIDTLFRPTPEQIAALFPSCSIVEGEILEDTTFLHDLWERGLYGAAKKIFSDLIRIPAIPFLKPGHAASRYQPYRWLFRRFVVSIVLLRKKLGDRAPARADQRDHRLEA